jgi:hypothetical protein
MSFGPGMQELSVSWMNPISLFLKCY